MDTECHYASCDVGLIALQRHLSDHRKHCNPDPEMLKFANQTVPASFYDSESDLTDLSDEEEPGATVVPTGVKSLNRKRCHLASDDDSELTSCGNSETDNTTAPTANPYRTISTDMKGSTRRKERGKIRKHQQKRKRQANDKDGERKEDRLHGLLGKERAEARARFIHGDSLQQRDKKTRQSHVSDFSAADLPIASTGWMGRYRAFASKLVREWKNQTIWKRMTSFKLIPFNRGNKQVPCVFNQQRLMFFLSLLDQGPTHILDCDGRLMIYRSRLAKWIINSLPTINAAATTFVEACVPMSPDKIRKNKRGRHWFSIAGHDRNNKQVRYPILCFVS